LKRLIDFLWKNSSKRDRRKFSIVVLATFISSLLEIVSIGMVIPVISILINPEKVFAKNVFDFLNTYLGLTDKGQIVTYFILFFVFVIIFSALFRIFTIRLSANFSFSFGAFISGKVYANILRRDFAEHKNINSSEDISKIITKITVVIQSLIFPVVMLGSAVFMFFVIFLTFSLVNVWLTLSLSIGLCFIYLMITIMFKKNLKENSIVISARQDQQIKNVQESISMIRDIIIDNTHSYYEGKYLDIENSLRERQASNIYVAQAPRFLIEAISIVFLMFFFYVAVFLLNLIEKDMVLPTFITVAVALQKILPIAQQAYRSWANIEGNKQSLYDVMTVIESKSKSIPLCSGIGKFDKDIVFNNISYKYPGETKNVLEKISLKITKGERIGIIGETGSGKSTLIDVLMGLLSPSDGQFLVDGCEVNRANVAGWYKKISHVPQSVPIIDADLQANITFGSEQGSPDENRIQEVIDACCLSGMFDSSTEVKSKTLGENGKKISGGQRQRVGIARCLYKRADVIVLDEATSALDSQTEDIIMNNLYSLDYSPTIIMIAHRVSTLRHCDMIIKINDGKIEKIGTYDDVVGGLDGY
jgi:ABC-type multidrug transport system fused ATPase/permease subunit